MTHRQGKPRPFTILLMGVTGSGKSTFASLASGQDLEIGHGLDPCTKRPEAVRFKLDNRPVTLIDTPGFDDDTMTDIEILQNVSQWMLGEGMIGPTNQTLDALILVHPVTRNSHSNMEVRRTRLLEKLLGKDAYKRVTIVTTMWDSLEASYASSMMSQFDLKTIREQDKKDKWTDFCKDGASIEKHYNTETSACEILRQIIGRHGATAKPSLFTLRAAFWQQLAWDLEKDIEYLHQEMIEHRAERLMCSGAEQWNQWEAENEELDKKSKRHEYQLKKVKGLLLLARGVGKFWTATKFLSRLLG